MKRFPEKRVVITGAGSGLGRALALELAAKQWRVGVAEVDRQRAADTVSAVDRIGGSGLDIPCDVTRPEDLENAARVVEKAWGGVDILINNAGVSAGGYFEKIEIEKWDWIYNINLKSIILGCRAFIPLLKRQKNGYIVNVASNAGMANMPEMASYNMTKAGSISISETLRVELAPYNIGVSVVCPTFFKTNLMDQFSSPDERQRQMAEKLFERSRTTPEDVARHTIRSVEKNRFYVVTQRDGKVIWWYKRHFPELYLKIASSVYKAGLMDRLLGIKP